MPISYEVIETKKLLIMTLVGEVSLDEITAMQNEMTTDASVRTCVRCLVDLESSIPADDSPSWMRSIAAQTKARGDLVQMAIVAPDDLRYGLSRAYEAYVNEATYETHVFKTRSEADEWLGL